AVPGRIGGKAVRILREVGGSAGRGRASVRGSDTMRALAVWVLAAVLTLGCAQGAASAAPSPVPLGPLRVSPTPGITEFAIPRAGGRPSAIALGRDGNLWFVETRHNTVGRITPRGKITE